MSFPALKGLTPIRIPHSMRLAESIGHIEEVAAAMFKDGFDVEGTSLKTVIADLQWQYEELLEKELLAEWPTAPRRAARASIRAHS
jgi:hypothetical protein